MLKLPRLTLVHNPNNAVIEGQKVAKPRKPGRNQPCPCGSNKKFKRCHGAFERAGKKLDLLMLRAEEARQKLRVRSQGHGRRIISAVIAGTRVVIVGRRRFTGHWPFFSDFLLAYLKLALGLDWGRAEAQHAPHRHPLFRWLDEMRRERDAQPAEARTAIASSSSGAAWAVFKTAYAIYLIEHHDQLPNRFRNRLRDPLFFLPAAYEALVGAAYAMAGYTIKSEETSPKASAAQPEFTVSRGGIAYSVEAKRKDGWASELNVDADEFATELGRFIRRELHASSKKGLPNPVFWFELSFPRALETAEASLVQRLIRETLRDAERTLTVGGKVPPAAYVYVTSHAFLSSAPQSGFSMVMLDGFHREVALQGEVEIEKLLSLHDDHRDAIWILDCLKQVAQVPFSFDGTPIEAFGQDGEPISTLKIGDRLEVENPDGDKIEGLIEEVTAADSHAYVVLHDEQSDLRRMATVPLTEDEQRAARAHGDLIFGKPNVSTKLEGDDFAGLYDFFLTAYAATPREKLLSFLKDHPFRDDYVNLPTDQLRQRVCREWVKGAVAEAARKADQAKG